VKGIELGVTHEQKIISATKAAAMLDEVHGKLTAAGSSKAILDANRAARKALDPIISGAPPAVPQRGGGAGKGPAKPQVPAGYTAGGVVPSGEHKGKTVYYHKDDKEKKNPVVQP
jgi:hypothetical protein